MIAIDRPGLGDSHPLPEPMSVPVLAACVADFLAALAAALERQPAKTQNFMKDGR